MCAGSMRDVFVLKACVEINTNTVSMHPNRTPLFFQSLGLTSAPNKTRSSMSEASIPTATFEARPHRSQQHSTEAPGSEQGYYGPEGLVYRSFLLYRHVVDLCLNWNLQAALLVGMTARGCAHKGWRPCLDFDAAGSATR